VYGPVVAEARLRAATHGLTPEGDGWFVVNAREARWREWEGFGVYCQFEGKRRFPQFGINVSVLEPGESLGLYHAEPRAQEDFLVLAGECLLLVEEQERPLRAWDFVHLPSMVPHVLVGAGTGPCVLLMAGARPDPEEIIYPVSELALRHGAGVEEATPDPDVAYRGLQRPPVPGRPEGWESLPWGGG
jgi:uncharacterized cupin superfamily protein